ncbi:hypothetical protein [Streptomyces sp. SJL17-4]|uniref:InlB B-repeat-containing protein n=1 Tax=Streptomyces sp. SJL17-4 TaxID=2967224 RepID=UPI0030D210A0
MTFPLFGDLTVQAVEESRSTVGSTLVRHGTVAGTVDQNVVLTLEGGCDGTPGNETLSAQFLLGGDLYAVEPLAPGRVTIVQLSPLTDEDAQPTGDPPDAAIAAEARRAPGPVARARAAAAACKGGKGYALIDALVGCTPPDPGPSTAAWGYSVVGQSAIARYSMGHEIGHNLSADHDRVTQPVQPEDGATGYFPPKGDWSSVMAYESSCRKATKGACTRINRFSNPRQTYRGETIGVPLGKPGQSDTSDVLSRTGTAVAAYRAAKTSDAMCAVTSSVSPKGAGTVEAATPGPYPQGTVTTHDAVAAKGYVFSGWTLDGEPYGGDEEHATGETAVTFAERGHTLTAVFGRA